MTRPPPARCPRPTARLARPSPGRRPRVEPCGETPGGDAGRDEAVGVPARDPAGNLTVTRVTLRPKVRFGGEGQPTAEELRRLHDQTHHACFIARSVKTEVVVGPR
jgi:hypothetical protein